MVDNHFATNSRDAAIDHTGITDTQTEGDITNGPGLRRNVFASRTVTTCHSLS